MIIKEPKGEEELNKEWLELERHIKNNIEHITQKQNIQTMQEFSSDGLIISTLYSIKLEMERIKSEFYYNSLKEAGYF